MCLTLALTLPLLTSGIVNGLAADTDVIGVDLSKEISVEEFKCLISNYSIGVMVTTAWNNGVYDNVSVINLNNAYSACCVCSLIKLSLQGFWLGSLVQHQPFSPLPTIASSLQ